MSYVNLKNKLRERFGSDGLGERYASELRLRRRKSNETWSDLHSEIRSVRLEYYDIPPHTVNIL